MWEYDQQMKLKVGLAEMLKGGVIMDVVNAKPRLPRTLAPAP
jgi:pyridoxal biosynthesis lyase PdxS